MNAKRQEIIFFLGLFLFALVIAFLVFVPYLSAIILAAVLAVSFNSLFQRILSGVRGHRSFAAFLTVMLVLVILLGPLVYFGFQLFQEASGLYASLTSGSVPPFMAKIQGLLSSFSGGAAINLTEYLKQIISWFLGNLGFIFSSLTQAFLTLLLGIMGMFYLLRDGERITSGLVSFIPLPRTYSEMIMNKMALTINSVVKGQLVVALVQGFLAGVSFAFFGIPNPVFWGAVTVIAALVPNVGTALVMVPAVGYLFFTSHTFSALGLLVWAIFAVGLIDNMLGPFLVKRGAHIHPFLVLLSVLGGVTVLGPIGFLAGPLLIGVLYALIDIYPRILKDQGII